MLSKPQHGTMNTPCLFAVSSYVSIIFFTHGLSPVTQLRRGVLHVCILVVCVRGVCACVVCQVYLSSPHNPPQNAHMHQQQECHTKQECTSVCMVYVSQCVCLCPE